MTDIDSSAALPLEAILALLSDELGMPAGVAVPLDGGITNRNYRVSFGDLECVVRCCGKETAPLGIDRDTEELAAARAAALGFAPRVVTRLREADVLVCEFVAGEPLTADQLREPTVLGAVARSLRAFHTSGDLPTAFAVFDLVDEQARVAGAAVPGDHAALLAVAQQIRAAVAGHPEHALAPCHNDLLSANFLRTPDGVVRLLDWEYAGMNDPFFDLGNLATNNGLDDADAGVLLAAYFGEPATDRRRAALDLFRIMSDFREGMWGVAQGVLSDLDFDYAQYAQEHLDRLRSAIANPQYEERIRIAGTP